jgi:hypothetical protein
MKKNLILLLSAALLVMATGCEKTSKGVTKITYYPVITLQGDNPYVVQLGGGFTEPGYSATLDGEDYTPNVKVSSNVNSDVPGIYSITYSATNPDGYSWSTTRDVYVLNPGGVANVYLANCSMGSRQYKNIPTVIKPISDGVYEIDDMCGGFYYAGRYPGYEPTYDFHADTQFSLAEDGSFVIKKVGSWYFVGSFDYGNITGGYDAETGIFDYDFDGLRVTLTPFEP